MHHLTESNIFIFLIQVILLLGCSKFLGELFRRAHQPTITAELLVGIFLGPTILGRFFPAAFQHLFPADPIQQTMLQTVAWFGVLFLLLETGIEIDFSSAWRQRGAALVIALADIAVPMLIGLIVFSNIPEHYLPDPNKKLIFILFMATTMTISAMPITARVLHDLKLQKTDLGFLIMSALSVNDIIGWVIFSLVLGMFTYTGVQMDNLFLMFALTIGFTFICLSFGRHVTDIIIGKMKKWKMPEPGSSLTFISLLGMLCGAVMHKLGTHALFGFFIAGIMVGEAKALSEKTRQVIAQMVYAIFVPLFFASIGLRVDFLKNFDLFLVIIVFCVGVSGKFLGAWLGAYYARISKSNRLPVAIAHISGGMMEIVVSLIALEYHLISETIFIALVLGAVGSSIILGPWLNWAINKRKEVSILEFFSRRGIIEELKANDRNAAILELCELAPEEENSLDAETIVKAVLKREEVMGTAVEEGVALPHARLPALMKSIILFGKSRAGIDWNSPDGYKSHFIFLILTPETEDDSQVQILRAIAKTLMHEKIRNELMRSTDAQEIWTILKQEFTNYQIHKKEGHTATV
jgi:Kef-type K+ transport system membrane component KefB